MIDKWWHLILQNSAGVVAISAVINIVAVILVAVLSSRPGKRQEADRKKLHEEVSQKVHARCVDYFSRSVKTVEANDTVAISMFADLDVPSEFLLLHLSPEAYGLLLDAQSIFSNLKYVASAGYNSPDGHRREPLRTEYVAKATALINHLERKGNSATEL